MRNSLITKILFALILILALGLRIYKLDTVPPSLNWDEVAAGYNAYTIANWGRDEWGATMPLVFTSFRDDKHPVHIYITALIIKLFGMTDFTVRLSGALIGILGVVIIFYLARIYFVSDLAALLAAFFLAISPYHLHFSRGLWEANFAPFFLMLGLLLFQLGLQKKSWLLIFAFFSFGLSLFSYHSSKIVVPPVVLLLIFLNIKSLIKKGIYFYISLAILILFIAIMVTDKRLLGLARAYQARLPDEQVQNSKLYQLTKNYYLGALNASISNYYAHFGKDFLFVSGGQSSRDSVKVFGEFYKTDALFIFVGFATLIFLRSKVTLIILTWLLLSPFPSSLTSNTPSATRAIFMSISLILVSAFGATTIINWFKGNFKKVVIVLIMTVSLIQCYYFLNYYLNTYPKKDAIDWVYGMKDIVEYVKNHPDYSQVFMTEIRSQPYIFFLYYLKYPLPDYLRYVVVNSGEESKSNTVAYFDKYYFGGWDFVESMPTAGVLYIVTPYQYTGLRHISTFQVKKIVYYPDGSIAFYLVSVK